MLINDQKSDIKFESFKRKPVADGEGEYSKKIYPHAIGAFVLMLGLCFFLVALMTSTRIQAEQMSLKQLILERSIRINETVSQLLFRAKTLASFVILNDGELEDFPQLAAILADDPAILNFLIAPGGVVSEIYPLEGNEVLLGLNLLLQDTVLSVVDGPSQMRLLATVAKESRELAFDGPFEAAQGGEIFVSRMPVFLENEDGSERFWGITGVTLRHPATFAGAGLHELLIMGYGYEIWREVFGQDERHIIISDGDRQRDYIEMPITILNTTWHFRIYADQAWYAFPETWLSILIGLCISLLLAIVMQNNRELKNLRDQLKKLSDTDPLTGINNRRYFMQTAEEQTIRISRQKSNSFILMMDLDHFKSVNDKYGHQAGDVVLKETALRISNILRPYDLLARYGGEEFIVFVSEIDKESVMQLAERIRGAVAGPEIKTKNASLSITVSIGVAPAVPASKLEEAIDFADKALYKAKADGRNKVVFYGEV